MTKRRSEDLPLLRQGEVPLPAKVRPFPIVLGPLAVFEMAQRQPERATETLRRLFW